MRVSMNSTICNLCEEKSLFRAGLRRWGWSSAVPQKATKQMRALRAAEKPLLSCDKSQGTTSQAAEKLIRAVGRGFIPGIKTMESAVALATEVCFCGESPEIRPFSAASLVVPQAEQKWQGFSP
jgi:hypothetical protein